MGYCKVPALIQAQVEVSLVYELCLVFDYLAIFIVGLMENCLLGKTQLGLVNEAEHKSLFRLETDSPQTKAASLMEQGGSLPGSFRERTAKSPKNSVLQSFKIVILSNKLNLLLPFGPLAILLHYLTDNKVSYCSFRY